jgi:hypothetical protein
MDQTFFLTVAFVCVTIGYISGILVSGQRRDQGEQDASAEDSSSQIPDDAIHIWRDPQKKQLILQMGKRTFHSGEGLPAAERKYMAQLVVYLQKWLGIPASRVSVPAERTAPSSQSESAPSSPRVDPVKGLASTLQPDTPEPPPESIVAQIDAILQVKLENTPLQDIGIRLMETPDGGMVVIVGLEQYQDVDSIPDESIKTIIRAAVSEWEQSQ